MTSRFQPLHLRHDEIHDGQVWLVVEKCLQSVATVQRLAYYDPFRSLMEDSFNSSSRLRIVIHQKNTNQAASLLQVARYANFNRDSFLSLLYGFETLMPIGNGR